MPINWGTFITKTSIFLDSGNSEGINDTAETITNEYHNAVSSAKTIYQQPVISSTLNPSAMKAGFVSGFKMLSTSPISVPVAPYTLMAMGVVGYWSTAQFVPVPPPPGYVSPTTGVTLLVPGTPQPLGALLEVALKSGSSSLVGSGTIVASALVAAFQAHLLTISGVYNGLIPGVPSPVPGPPLPWVGII